MTQIDSQARAQSPLQSPEVPKVPTEHVEDVEDVDPDLKGVRGVDRVGLAVIEQKTVIPQTGERMITSQWEYWLFCVFCERSVSEDIHFSLTEKKASPTKA